MDDAEIVKEFLIESYENLDRLDQDLVTLEKDPGNRDTLASIFRTIHTIKGTLGFLAFNQLAAGDRWYRWCISATCCAGCATWGMDTTKL